MSSGKSIGGVANIQNRDSINAENVDYDDPLNLYPPTVVTVEDALDYIAGAMPPTVASMLPLVEGIAYGETDQLGRTMLGYGVDNSSSNNIAFWSSGGGTPQALCNSTSAITAFIDTNTTGATMLNSVVMLESGSVAGTNLSNSVVLGRGSDFSNGIDYTQSNIVANEYVSQVGDELSTTQAMIRGSFEQPSQFTNSVVLGEVNNLRTLGTADAAIVIRPGNAGGAPVRVAAGGCLIGQGVAGTVVSTGEFRLSAYNNYYVDGIPAAPAANVLVYDTVTNRITYDTASSAASMTPTVEGLAFGSQDLSKELNSLGPGVSIDPTTNRATARYNPLVAGTPQPAVYSSCLFDSNRSDQSAVTSISDSIVTTNEGDLNDIQVVKTILDENITNVSATNFGDSIVEINEATMKSASVLNSTVIASRVDLNNAVLDRSTLIVSGLSAPSIGFDGATMLGDCNSLAITDMRESMFLASNAGSPIDQQGRQSLYVGNQTANEIINNREAWLSSYDRFYFRTLRADTSSGTVCYYDPSSAELTYGAAPSPPAKQPTTLGGQYGINSLGNASDVNGRDSFVNYAAGPVQLSGVSSVGNSQFQVNNPGLSAFTNCIFLGRTHSFNAVQTVTDTLLAANIVTGANISQIVNSNIIVPKAGSLTFTYAGAVTGANIVSSGAVICVSDPLYSTVLSSGGSVTPAGSNLVLATNQGGGSISMNGSGNSLVFSAGNSVAYSWPVGVSNSCVLQNGTSVVTPSASTQLCSNHTSFRMPNINSAGIADINTSPMAFNSGTGLISPTLSPLLSRVYRAVGTTGVGGQVTFTPGGSINPSTVGYAFNATVRNTSTTVAYTCSINTITGTSVTIQVFNSVTVVLASPSMVPSGAGIQVHFSMNY